MKMLSPVWIVQQNCAFDEDFKLVKALLDTGKCQVEFPPDCFLWSGTQKELENIVTKFKSKVEVSNEK